MSDTKQKGLIVLRGMQDTDVFLVEVDVLNWIRREDAPGRDTHPIKPGDHTGWYDQAVPAAVLSELRTRYPEDYPDGLLVTEGSFQNDRALHAAVAVPKEFHFDSERHAQARARELNVTIVGNYDGMVY